MSLFDQKILNDLSNNNPKAFEEFFRITFPELLKYTYSLTLSKEVSEEIVQDAFIYVWKNCSKISISASLKAYLLTSVKNASINYLKNKSKKAIDVEISEVSLMSYNEVFSQHIDTKELKKNIKKAINSLPGRCRTIFLLSRFTDMTYAQIATELDISVKTVEAQMSIALVRIRKYLDKNEMLYFFLFF
jgi:RNA polymerase sigma-70 factor, ECF subfamily